MDKNQSTFTCTQGCWMAAALAGLLIAALLILRGWGFISALFIGILVLVVLGFLLKWFFCSVQDEAGQRPEQTMQSQRQSAEIDISLDKATPAQDKSAPTGPAIASSAVKPSKPLPGQLELAERKGDWKYHGAAAASAPQRRAPKKSTAKKADSAGAPSAQTGAKPQALSAPRDGRPDDLKMIKGVGPKLEALLNSMGFYHFDQIASWSGSEVAWVDENLQRFTGRVSRDAWVDQAKTLAAGGTTEFSSKVKKGGVY